MAQKCGLLKNVVKFVRDKIFAILSQSVKMTIFKCGKGGSFFVVDGFWGSEK